MSEGGRFIPEPKRSAAELNVETVDMRKVPDWHSDLYSERVMEENVDVAPTVELGSNFAKPAYAAVVADFSVSNGVRDSDMDYFEPTLTRQEFKDECDINVIMKQYDNALAMPMGMPVGGQYLDLTQAPVDLMSALNVMNDATAAFMTLPAAVRKEFDNDPKAFIAFAQDDKNLPRMREWGLAEPEKPAPVPLEVRVVPDPNTPPPPAAPKAP